MDTFTEHGGTDLGRRILQRRYQIGLTRVVTTPSELETVRSLGIEPWAGGSKDTYLRITITEITGRRIRASR
jgi:hypothetical protein